jgi:hypothetical protein
MSIQEGWARIKGILEDRQGILVPTIVILVGLASFGLGRISALEDAKKPLYLATYSTKRDSGALKYPGGAYVGSRGGKSYHFPWCPGAESIKEANKVWFKDEEEARKKGYKPAGNCPGLGD